MLARDRRLRRPKDIARVYKRGTYGRGGGVLSVKAALSGQPSARVVIVVSKKVDKRAVVRNRLRRRLSADLERHWATVRPGYDIVVNVHSDISALEANQLHDYLARALTAAGVIR